MSIAETGTSMKIRQVFEICGLLALTAQASEGPLVIDPGERFSSSMVGLLSQLLDEHNKATDQLVEVRVGARPSGDDESGPRVSLLVDWEERRAEIITDFSLSTVLSPDIASAILENRFEPLADEGKLNAAVFGAVDGIFEVLESPLIESGRMQWARARFAEIGGGRIEASQAPRYWWIVLALGVLIGVIALFAISQPDVQYSIDGVAKQRRWMCSRWHGPEPGGASGSW